MSERLAAGTGDTAPVTPIANPAGTGLACASDSDLRVSPRRREARRGEGADSMCCRRRADMCGMTLRCRRGAPLVVERICRVVWRAECVLVCALVWTGASARSKKLKGYLRDGRRATGPRGAGRVPGSGTRARPAAPSRTLPGRVLKARYIMTGSIFRATLTSEIRVSMSTQQTHSLQ